MTPPFCSYWPRSLLDYLFLGWRPLSFSLYYSTPGILNFFEPAGTVGIFTEYGGYSHKTRCCRRWSHSSFPTLLVGLSEWDEDPHLSHRPAATFPPFLSCVCVPCLVVNSLHSQAQMGLNYLKCFSRERPLAAQRCITTALRAKDQS